LNEQNDRFTKQLDGFRDRAVSSLARGDAEMEKKIKHHFETTLKSVKAETDAEIANKVRQAYQLAQDPSDVPDPLMGAVMGGAPGYNRTAINEDSKQFTPQQKAVGSLLGITEADYQKYGNDPRRTH